MALCVRRSTPSLLDRDAHNHARRVHQLLCQWFLSTVGVVTANCAGLAPSGSASPAPDARSGAVRSISSSRQAPRPRSSRLLPAKPILSPEDALPLVDAPRSSVLDALKRLRDAAVFRALTDRKRNQIWGAGLVLDELTDLGVRIADAIER
jgi:hypothetical protein